MNTKQDIIDEVLSSRLTAMDIHLFSERMIPLTQCHDLLRTGKMSTPTALLLRGYAARVGRVDGKKDELVTTVVEGVTESYVKIKELVEDELPSRGGEASSAHSAWRTGDAWAGSGRFFKVGSSRNPDTGKIVNCHKFSIREGGTSVGLAAVLDENEEFLWNGKVYGLSEFSKSE